MNLWDLPHSKRNDPHTSKEAEEKVNIPKQAAMVYTAFCGCAPCTMEELSRKSGIDYYICQRRISDLRRSGRAHRKKIGEKNGKDIFETRNGGAVWYRQ
jgi:hypothetical protein